MSDMQSISHGNNEFYRQRAFRKTVAESALARYPWSQKITIRNRVSQLTFSKLKQQLVREIDHASQE